VARLSGKNGRLYAGVTSGGTAEPIAFINSFSLSFTTDKQDVTCFGDTGKVYVSGFADATGDFAGFYDDATNQLYTAATDGVARRMYLYPDMTTNTKYWFGTAIFDFSVQQNLSGGVAISGSWAAASSITKVG
jgi:hypothetical protein